MNLKPKHLKTPLAMALLAVGLYGPQAQAADCSDGQSFTTPNAASSSLQSCTVPAGVTQITVTACGAKGGNSFSPNAGGNGAQVSRTLVVTPGDTLGVAVGGAGGQLGGLGINGGGSGHGSGAGGGGWSGAFLNPTGSSITLPAATANIIVLAGGGGGAGATQSGAPAGTGTDSARTSGTGGNGGAESGGGGGGFRGGSGGTTFNGGGGGSSTIDGTTEASATPTSCANVGNGKVTLSNFVITQPKTIFVDDRPSSTANDGTSWAKAYFLLQDAISAASAGDSILVAAGTYRPGFAASDTFNLKSGVAVYGGFKGDEVVSNLAAAVAARDLKTHVSILSGDVDNNDGNGVISGTNANRVVTAANVNDQTILDGFTVTGAVATQSGGGGIVIQSGDARMSNLVVQGNQSLVLSGMQPAGSGAGINILGGSSPWFTNLLVTGNYSNHQAAGLYVDAPVQARLANVTVSGNRAEATAGGVFVHNIATVKITNALLWGNSAPASANLFNDSNDLFVHHSLIEGCNPNGVWSHGCGVEFDTNLADADPKFVSPVAAAMAPTVNGNYRLQSGSPVIDKGSATEYYGEQILPAKDLDGSDRVKSTAVDLGPYEGSAGPVDGLCGSANASPASSTPAAALCETGTAGAVSSASGSWAWSCAGSNGGSDASCAAPYQTQSITSFIASPTTIVIGGMSAISASSSSGKPVNVTSGTTTTCSVSISDGYIATGLAAGACSVLGNVPASPAGCTSGCFQAAPQVSTGITVNKKDQTLVFGFAPSGLVVGGSAPLLARADSALEVSFSTLLSNICSVSGSTVTTLKAGSCTVYGNQAGDATYNAAPQQSQTFQIGQGSQSITGFMASPLALVAGGSPATLIAGGGNSGNPVVFASGTPSTCSVSGQSVSGTAEGQCTVTANQAGNTDYTAAEQATLTLQVSKPASMCEAYRNQPNVNVIDLSASPGGQTVRGVTGKYNVIIGSQFADTITGGNLGNCIDGGPGNDRLTAGSGDNHLYGAEGNDTLTPGGSSTAMDGGEGNDKCGRASGRATATYASCESN